MAYIMVDVESDGPIPGDYSMVCFGAIVVEPALDRTFYGRLKPISDKWIPEALQVSGFTREETLAFDDPQAVMQQFADWLAGVGDLPGDPAVGDLQSQRIAEFLEEVRVRPVRPAPDCAEVVPARQAVTGAHDVHGDPPRLEGVGVTFHDVQNVHDGGPRT